MKYKSRHDWVGKMVHWKLCKGLQLDHTNKWCEHKPKSVLGSETHNIHCSFEIQTDHPIPARRPDLVLINKKKKIKENAV